MQASEEELSVALDLLTYTPSTVRRYTGLDFGDLHYETFGSLAFGIVPSGITPSRYEAFRERFGQYLRGELPVRSETEPGMRYLARIGRFPVPLGKALLTPTKDWNADECWTYFRAVCCAGGADVDEALKSAFSDGVDGALFASGDLASRLSEETWDLFVQAHNRLRFDNEGLPKELKDMRNGHIEHYGFSFSTTRPLTRRPGNSDSITAAFSVDLQEEDYSRLDFVRAVKEVLSKKPSYTPCVSKREGKVLPYFSNYFCLLQSTCAGKTRFLLDFVKEDAELRTFTIYINLDLKPNTVGTDTAGIEPFLNVLHSGSHEAVANHLVRLCGLVAEKIMNAEGTALTNPVVDPFRPIHDSDKWAGSRVHVLLGENWKKATEPKLSVTDINRIRAKLGAMRHKSKKLQLVIAIDEAHLLLPPKAQYIRARRLDQSDPIKSAQGNEGGQIAVATVEEASEEGLNGERPTKMLRRDVGKRSVAAPRGSSDRVKRMIAKTRESLGKDKDKPKKTEDVVSPFRRLRRALIYMERHMKITVPVVLSSTVSRLGNFMPRIDDDPSRNRGRLDNPETLSLLHRPTVLRESFRIYEHKVHFPKDDEWGSYIWDKEFVLHLAYYGRPLWGSLLEASEDRIAGFHRALQLIEEKFSFAAFGEVDSTMASSIVEYELALNEESRVLECFGNTVYIPPLETNDHAATLVKSRYGFLASFDNLTCRYKVGFYSEPLVALFCLRALYAGSGLRTALSTLTSTAAAGVFDLGKSGELVARLLLLSAVVKAGPEKVNPEGHLGNFGTEWPLEYLLPRRFGDVLEMLVGTLPKGFRASNKDYLDGHVVLTHWMLAERSSLASSMCGFALRRTAGIVMPTNTKGVDLLIPLVTARGRITAVLIQVKNVKSPDASSTIYKLMEEQAKEWKLDDPFYLILMLKPGEACADWIEVDDGQRVKNGLVIQGIRHGRLEKEFPKGTWEEIVSLGDLARGETNASMHIGPYLNYAEAVKTNNHFRKLLEKETREGSSRVGGRRRKV